MINANIQQELILIQVIDVDGNHGLGHTQGVGNITEITIIWKEMNARPADRDGQQGFFVIGMINST